MEEALVAVTGLQEAFNQNDAPLDKTEVVEHLQLSLTVPPHPNRAPSITTKPNTPNTKVWATLLGTQHDLAREHRDYCNEFVAKEVELENVQPRNPRHHMLAPALLARRTQLEVAFWLRRQQTTHAPVPAP